MAPTSNYLRVTLAEARLPSMQDYSVRCQNIEPFNTYFNIITTKTSLNVTSIPLTLDSLDLDP